jgi:hypothetical protein
LFWFSGRKSVKITEIIPGKEPKVTYTTGMREHKQQQPPQQQTQQPSYAAAPPQQQQILQQHQQQQQQQLTPQQQQQYLRDVSIIFYLDLLIIN